MASPIDGSVSCVQNGVVPQNTSMATISQTDMGLMAFVDDGINKHSLVMMAGEPIVSYGMKVTQLQAWITTLEQMIHDTPASAHRQAWEEMLAFYNASLRKSAENHDKLVALSDHDASLSAYLTAYCNAVGVGGV